MNWTTLVLTFAFLGFAYVIGSINNSIIVTKMLGLEDPRKKGSGNAGATNTTMSYGMKVGLPVFILDILKPIIAMIIPYFALHHYDVLVPVIGIGAIIGHIWPMFHGFKGGKGAASMLGFIIFVSWLLAVIGAVLFLALVWKTKKVSLGSVLVSFICLMLYLIIAFAIGYRETWIEPLTNVYQEWWLVFGPFAIIWCLVVWSHRGNIKRLIKGEERNFKLNKENKS